eukprot:1151186-Pelagomonas_calceolata.AAC.2
MPSHARVIYCCIPDAALRDALTCTHDLLLHSNFQHQGKPSNAHMLEAAPREALKCKPSLHTRKQTGPRIWVHDARVPTWKNCSCRPPALARPASIPTMDSGA